MIISEEHGFVFVKGVKVGGTSVELFLANTLGESAIVAPAAFGNPAFRARNYKAADPSAPDLTNHSSAADARTFLGPDRFARLRRALILRNPFEKIRSFLYFRMGQGVLDMPVGRAIEECSSEAVRGLDEEGRCLITDLLFHERLDSDLAAFFGSVGVPFGGRLEIFEKSWQRRRYGQRPVVFSSSEQEAIRAKFAFEFERYAEAGLAAEPTPGAAETMRPSG